jgi:hypothetical protein
MSQSHNPAQKANLQKRNKLKDVIVLFVAFLLYFQIKKCHQNSNNKQQIKHIL